MPTIKTQLEWAYTPIDFFEAPTVLTLPEGQVRIEAGKVTLELVSPTDPVPPSLCESTTDRLRSAFGLRQILTRRVFDLSRPTEIQHQAAGSRTVSVASAASVVVSGVLADAIVTDSQGRVVSDTRAERVAAQTAFVVSLLGKLSRSPTLRLMAISYGRSIEDPSNELVHLYEIRDAAKKHFGGEAPARAALGISKSDWSELGRLANDEPLRQGRHRGQQLGGLRDATTAELDVARSVARKMFDAFAATV